MRKATTWILLATRIGMTAATLAARAAGAARAGRAAVMEKCIQYAQEWGQNFSGGRDRTALYKGCPVQASNRKR